jgi:hypothetical protein
LPQDATLRVSFGGWTFHFPFKPLPGLAGRVVGLPVGLPGFPDLFEPTWATVERAI